MFSTGPSHERLATRIPIEDEDDDEDEYDPALP
jgi:hypothetical protein